MGSLMEIKWLTRVSASIKTITIKMIIFLKTIFVIFPDLFLRKIFKLGFVLDVKFLFKYNGDANELDAAAKRLQMLVQKLIFASLTIVLALKGGFEFLQTIHWVDVRVNYQYLMGPRTFIEHILAINTLQYVAKALAVSCGVQLAYMLVTDGPDEAVEPLMLGIASAILLILSSTSEWDFNHAVAIFLLVLTIPMLYLIAKKIKNDQNK
ncbi:hypothetical protein D9B84_01935 [Serratia marcescens]|nr:hypothetical protein D9B84_01935 [Serratia marcescens]